MIFIRHKHNVKIWHFRKQVQISTVFSISTILCNQTGQYRSYFSRNSNSTYELALQENGGKIWDMIQIFCLFAKKTEKVGLISNTTIKHNSMKPNWAFIVYFCNPCKKSRAQHAPLRRSPSRQTWRRCPSRRREARYGSRRDRMARPPRRRFGNSRWPRAPWTPPIFSPEASRRLGLPLEQDLSRSLSLPGQVNLGFGNSNVLCCYEWECK